MAVKTADAFRLACAVGATLAAAAVEAAGAVPGPAQAPGTGLETVTVYARRITPVSQVAATVTIIGRETIERALVTDVKELVRYEPGLSVRSDPFRFGSDTIAIRGIGGNRVAVEVDGVPASGGFAVGSFADSGRNFVDAAFLERVEVLRGPASSLYGSDAIGGVVAMSTIGPDDLLDGSRDASLRITSGFSGVDDGWNAAALGAARNDTASAMLGYVHRAGGEPDTAARVEPNPRDYRSDAVLAKLELAGVPGGPLSLAAEASRLRQDTEIDAWLGLAGSRFANTTLLHGADESRRGRLSVRQRLAPTAAYGSAEWLLYAQDTITRQDTQERRRAVPPRTPPLAIERGFRLEERTIGAEFTAVRAFDAVRTSHTVVYGLELAGSRLEERRNGTQTDLDTGVATSVILGESFPLRDFPVTDVTRVGVFAQDEVRVAGTRWTLIPALRADRYELSPRPDRLYREDNPHAAAVGLDDFALAPKLGVTRELDGGAVVFAQYAHGFRAPPPEDLNIGLELPLFNLRAIPNPDLRPESSDGLEAGLRRTGAGGDFAVSAYYTAYTDFIESKVNLGKDPLTGVTLFQSQNVAEARIYGVELAAQARLGEWAAPLEGFSARFAAAWSRGEDLVTDRPLNSVEPAHAVLSLGYESAAGRWGGELVTTAAAPKRAVDDSRADLFRTGGHVALDLLLHVELGGGLRLNAAIFNLADADYIEWADVRGRVAGDPLLPYYTRPGRSASVTLHWQF